MKLKEYIEATKVKICSFATKIGVNHNTIFRITQGGDVLLSTALRIEEQTNGIVTVYDLRPIPKERKPVIARKPRRKAKDQVVSNS